MEELQFVLKKMTMFHCKRGPKNCSKCKNLDNIGEQYCVLRIFKEDDFIARPLIELDVEGEKYWFPFEFYKNFNSKENALDYAKDKNIQLYDTTKDTV